MAPGRQDLHPFRGDVRDPAAGHLPPARQQLGTANTLTSTPAREARRRSKKERLQQAALRLFAERGYHLTSVDDLVAQARTSKSAFYEFYPSKEECLCDILAEQGGALMQALISATAGADGHRDRMRLGIRSFVAALSEQPQLARLLLVESVGVSEPVEAIRHRLHDRFAHMVEVEARRAAAEDPHYADVDPVVFGRAVVGAVHEATGHFLVQEDGGDPERLAEGLCRIFAP